MKKALIIGAGLSGLTAARILAEHGFLVTVLEKRDHIGGNVYDYFENDILVHKYGPHLFHTRQKEIADFIQRFSEFFPYEHRVLGEIKDKLVPIPFNFKSIDLLFPAEEAEHLKEVLTRAYPDGGSVPIMELREHPDTKVKELAEFVFQNVFCGYTKKQWGKTPEEMDSSVMGRVPVRMSYDDRYFTDEFQMMPVEGYTAMLRNMAEHENISIRYCCDALRHLGIVGEKLYFDKELCDYPVIYTGCVEDLLGAKFGRLPYRSLRFEAEHKNVTQAQPVVQVNYPNCYSYTRTSEFKLVQKKEVPGRTIVIYEYPLPCKEGDIPYYPAESEESREIYNRYRTELKRLPNLYLLGRLAEYKYYNMDMAISQALMLARSLTEKEDFVDAEAVWTAE